MQSLQQIDERLFRSLNLATTNGFLDWLMPRITNLHHVKLFIAVVILGCVWALWKGDRRIRVWVLCALIAVGLSDFTASHAVKRLIHRERPCQRNMVRVRLVPGEHCPGSSSFPSNHASNMMALGVVCWWFTRSRARWLWFLIPLVIGYSRIYLGYHYPSDVLGGWLLGALIAVAVLYAARRWTIDDRRLTSDDNGRSSSTVHRPSSSPV